MRSSFSFRWLASVASISMLMLPLPTLAMGFAPANRPVYTYSGTTTRGAGHVVFNSFLNTPGVGDERGFLSAKPATDATDSNLSDDLAVRDGQEIILRTYVHNNADASLNSGGQGIARNTRVRIKLPTASNAALGVISYVSADNADTGVTDADGRRNVVSDSVRLHSAAAPFRLEYVAGSARLKNAAHPAGHAMPDSIVGSTGARIGYQQLDGNVPGCFAYVGIVTIKVKVHMAAVAARVTPVATMVPVTPATASPTPQPAPLVATPQPMRTPVRAAAVAVTVARATPTPAPAPTPAPDQPALPATGATGAAAGILGLGSLAFTSRAYWRSRSQLKRSLRQR